MADKINIRDFRWGIFGTGNVAAKFAVGLNNLPQTKVVAIASREPTRAKGFADGLGLKDVTCGTYEEVATMQLDAIYIATPPSLHKPHALMCINAGTPILVEKPFSLTATEGVEITNAARAKNIFVMEAMWTRFQPVWRRTKVLLDEGALGDLRLIGGRFCMAEHPSIAKGLFNPKTGGGVLLDRGVYLVSLALYVLGKPEYVAGQIYNGPSGVDEQAVFSLGWGDATYANFEVSLNTNATNSFYLSGTKAQIELAAPVYRPLQMHMTKTPPAERIPETMPSKPDTLREGTVAQLANQIIQPRLAALINMFKAPAYRGNAYHYQALEVMECIRAGKKESAIMPLEDSITTLLVLDQLRN